MKTTSLILAVALLFATTGHGQPGDARLERIDAATAFTFTGKILFHDPFGNTTYDLTVTKGEVSGWQRWRGTEKPVGEIVGGWFDFDQGKLSLLMQGADHVQATWRSQIKQFHLDLPKKELTLDYELYDYGQTVEPPLVGRPHVLDALDRVQHLVE